VQNAYTSADETVYELLVPVDKPEVWLQNLNRWRRSTQHPACSGTVLDCVCVCVCVCVRVSQLLRNALAVFAEFAGRVVIADADLDRERGAVLEEWRQVRAAAATPHPPRHLTLI
jgi:predicted Zn-dependent peptidase